MANEGKRSSCVVQPTGGQDRAKSEIEKEGGGEFGPTLPPVPGRDGLQRGQRHLTQRAEGVSPPHPPPPPNSGVLSSAPRKAPSAMAAHRPAGRPPQGAAYMRTMQPVGHEGPRGWGLKKPQTHFAAYLGAKLSTPEKLQRTCVVDNHIRFFIVFFCDVTA